MCRKLLLWAATIKVLFSSQQTFARIEYLRASLLLLSKDGVFSVKAFLKTLHFIQRYNSNPKYNDEYAYKLCQFGKRICLE